MRYGIFIASIITTLIWGAPSARATPRSHAARASKACTYFRRDYLWQRWYSHSNCPACFPPAGLFLSVVARFCVGEVEVAV